MDINEIEPIFKKLGGKNTYTIKVFFEQKFTRSLFEKIVQRFIYSTENGGLEYKYEMKSLLNVILPKTNYNLNIIGKDEVKRYWQNNKIPENIDSFRKENFIQTHVIDKFGVMVRLIGEELKAIDKEVEAGLKDEKVEKEYIFKNYYEIKDPNWHFDTLLIEEKKTKSGKNFRESNCLINNPEYKMEIFFKHDFTHSVEFMEYFEEYLRWLLEEIQQTNFIVTLDEKRNLLNSFRKLTRQLELKGHNFILPEPVQILRRNFHREEKVPYVRENYSVTFLPRGELRFLYIPENFSKNISGKIFMISRTFEVFNTGKNVEGFENSLLEGYFCQNTNIFYITDIIFYKGNDLRNIKFYERNPGPTEKLRYDYLQQFNKEALQNSKYTDPNLREESVKFITARYFFGNEDSFWENVRELLERTKQEEYVVDGLLFRPILDIYPKRGGYWYSLLKWNEPEDITLDFLVRYVKDGKNDKLSPYQLPKEGKDLEAKIIYYKTLQLFVGGYRDILNENGNEKKIYTIVDYLPRGTDPRMNVNLANIKLNDARKVVATDLLGTTEEIFENDIVEFKYHHEYLFRWKPFRVNQNKTQMFRNGDSMVLMSETYGNHMWAAVTNPISKNNLMEGTVPSESVSNVYYSDNTMRLKKFPFQIFHNRIVKDNLIKGVCPAVVKKSKEEEGSLLDLAVGSGGDAQKWKLGRLKTVVGLDIFHDNILTAINLYKNVRRPRPDATFIWGDSTKLIFPNYDASMDYNSKEMMKKTFLSKYLFDVVSLQFAIHYMFESEITLRALLQNVTDNLKVGGYFIGTSLDGERVYDLMNGEKKPVEGLVGDDLLWRITKEYDLKKWDKKKSNVGHKIKVYVSTIGVPHEEYLVNYDYLKEIAKEYGLEVVRVRGFGDLYEESLRDKGEWDEELRNMSPGEKVFSFLHNEFVFEKKKDAPDTTFKKLSDMIKKKEKKESIKEKLQNNSKKFTIKLRSEK